MTNKLLFSARMAAILLLGAWGLPAAQTAPGAKGAQPAPAGPATGAMAGHRAGRRVRVDKSKAPELNHASKEALVRLPGVTPALADRIIAGRPYYSTVDLVIKGIITKDHYVAIHDQIIVAPPPVKPMASPKP